VIPDNTRRRAKSHCRQSGGQAGRSDRIEDVIGVAGPDHLRIERILADEDSSGAQDPVDLGEEAARSSAVGMW
jgi:hypothetical protein